MISAPIRPRASSATAANTSSGARLARHERGHAAQRGLRVGQPAQREPALGACDRAAHQLREIHQAGLGRGRRAARRTSTRRPCPTRGPRRGSARRPTSARRAAAAPARSRASRLVVVDPGACPPADERALEQAAVVGPLQPERRWPSVLQAPTTVQRRVALVPVQVRDLGAAAARRAPRRRSRRSRPAAGPARRTRDAPERALRLGERCPLLLDDGQPSPGPAQCGRTPRRLPVDFVAVALNTRDAHEPAAPGRRGRRRAAPRRASSACWSATASRSSAPRATRRSCSRTRASTTPDLAIVDIRMPPTHTTEGLDAAHGDPARAARRRRARAVGVHASSSRRPS